jgi:glycosyltransferase involved in cell wall biosynthesis
MQKIKSIGLTGYYLDTKGVSVNNTVFGSKVAVNDLLKAFFKYSSCEEICFSYIDMYYQHIATKRMYDRLKKTGQAKVNLKIINRMDMLQKGLKYDTDIIHDLYSDFLHTALIREYYTAAKPPLTYTIHCASAPDYAYGYYLINLFTGLKKYDSMICTSKAVKSAIENELGYKLDCINRLYGANISYNGRLDIIPLGVDTDDFHAIDKAECREKLGFAQNEFIILYFGRISAFDKGDILPLINVFHRLLVKNGNKALRLIIAGTDYEDKAFYPAIEKYIAKLQIEDRVQIMKDFEYGKRNVLYGAADVFTSPADSLQETFGLTPIEAMACGTPQIVSDWDGYKDTVRHGVTGFKVPSYWMKCDGDISLFPYSVNNEFGHGAVYSHLLLSQSVALDMGCYENYFQQLMDDPGLCRRMSENSCKIAKREYSLENVIRNYEELWRELLQIRKSEEAGHVNYMEVFHNRYCQAFENYPTRFIDDSERIKITGDGLALLRGDGYTPFHYAEEKLLYEIKVAKHILATLEEANERMISEILRECCGSVNEDAARRAVMWLLKHGFIKLA